MCYTLLRILARKKEKVKRARDLLVGWFQEFWLARGNYLVSATIFELVDGEERYLVDFSEEQVKFFGIHWIRYFRIPATSEEISQYTKKLQLKGVPVWFREISSDELDNYIKELDQNFSWRSTDSRSFRTRKRSIAPSFT